MRDGVCTGRVALAAFDAAAALWREDLEDLGEDVLAGAAVGELVRGLLGQSADWQQSIGEPGRALTTATEGRPLSGWSTDAGRTEDVGWRQAPRHADQGRRTSPPRSPVRRHVEPGGELELPATRNGRFGGAAVPEGCAVSDAGRRRCGGRRPVR